jgi:prepilin-type N-terminal cleavage/methylation domain-containing protein/prepilin-type processing-associated H-X9-DG protein
MNTRTSANSGFTLIELLVVIAIICILAALLFPALKAANASRDETVALSNMRQIGAAFTLYANDNSYMLPSRVTTASGGQKWPGLLSKYLSDVRVFASSFDLKNWVAIGQTPAYAISDNGNNTSFIMNGYNDLGTMTNGGNSPAPAVQIRINAFPNTSEIILLGIPKEPTASNPTLAHNTQYYMDFEEYPNGNEYDVLDLSQFNGGSNYLFADGSARFITAAAYNVPLVGATNAVQTYGNSLWCVNKSYSIPVIGNGGH